MALPNDIMKLITRNAGRDVAAIVEKTEQAAKAKADLKVAEETFEEKVKSMQTRLNESLTQGVEQAAISGAVGFGIGGGIAYLFHDNVSAYFGKGSWPALLTLPAAGVVVIAITPGALKDKRSQPGQNAAMRAGGYGLGLGLALVGGYLSYQDYIAKK